LFVYLPGKSRDEAFDIGDEIAKTITSMNPRPIKLKFEKVARLYFPLLNPRFTILPSCSQKSGTSDLSMRNGLKRNLRLTPKVLRRSGEMGPPHSRKWKKPLSRSSSEPEICQWSKNIFRGNV
jgi:hypothetical protein